jgi:hypothetical protein
MTPNQVEAWGSPIIEFARPNEQALAHLVRRGERDTRCGRDTTGWERVSEYADNFYPDHARRTCGHCLRSLRSLFRACGV